MAVKIRLRRMGGKNNPNYRIIVADSRSPRNGKFIEEIGRYVPQAEPKIVEFNKEIARDWISKGAQPTDTVARLFRDYGLFEDSTEDTSLTAEEAQEVEDTKEAEVEEEERSEEEAEVQEETEDQD